jgi:alkanesulfonate monooxygenase SsuD/methylene tetrahydromethanopterin reductase-like flavin-dependent oxidoreductase (luciferase family)
MRFGMSIKNMDEYANLDDLLALAIDAEDAGWHGIFLWDHILHIVKRGREIIDPWIALAAIAANTKKIQLGPLVTPLPRRRPWKVAREAVTLDHLSKGRLILGVGLGWPPSNDFERFGEEGDNMIRAEKLDESLEILRGLWSGEPFGYQGKHYQITEDTIFSPKPYKKSGIPIWVGGGRWPRITRPFRRAAKHDGVCPSFSHKDGQIIADHHAQLAQFIKKYRGNLNGFDFVTSGISPRRPDKLDALFSPIIEAGNITWWIEKVYSWTGNLDAIRRKIKRGPPPIQDLK